MSFGGMDHGSGPSQPISDINVTPLVDVLLVLLIIMMVTAPLLTQAVSIDLPKAQAQNLGQTQQPLQVALDAQGQLYVDGQALTLNEAEALLRQRVQAAGATSPTVHLSADAASRYQQVAETMAMVKNTGISKLAFVMQPPASGTAAR